MSTEITASSPTTEDIAEAQALAAELTRVTQEMDDFGEALRTYTRPPSEVSIELVYIKVAIKRGERIPPDHIRRVIKKLRDWLDKVQSDVVAIATKPAEAARGAARLEAQLAAAEERDRQANREKRRAQQAARKQRSAR